MTQHENGPDKHPGRFLMKKMRKLRITTCRLARQA
jgi:hypothetical protein